MKGSRSNERYYHSRICRKRPSFVEGGTRSPLDKEVYRFEVPYQLLSLWLQQRTVFSNWFCTWGQQPPTAIAFSSHYLNRVIQSTRGCNPLNRKKQITLHFPSNEPDSWIWIFLFIACLTSLTQFVSLLDQDDSKTKNQKSKINYFSGELEMEISMPMLMIFMTHSSFHDDERQRKTNNSFGRVWKRRFCLFRRKIFVAPGKFYWKAKPPCKIHKKTRHELLFLLLSLARLLGNQTEVQIPSTE